MGLGLPLEQEEVSKKSENRRGGEASHLLTPSRHTKGYQGRRVAQLSLPGHQGSVSHITVHLAILLRGRS
jgi:hypothetical protein